MYDNDSSDQSRGILRKHQESGFVSVRDWHHQGAQTEALNDCLCRFRHASRYVLRLPVALFPAVLFPLLYVSGGEPVARVLFYEVTVVDVFFRTRDVIEYSEQVNKPTA